MKSELPKVLIPVAGRPMIEYVLDALAAASVKQTIVVIGYRGDMVRKRLAARPGITFVEQKEQLGTGHAVMAARDALKRHDGPVLVVTGDSPLMQSTSIATFLKEFTSYESGLSARHGISQRSNRARTNSAGCEPPLPRDCRRTRRDA